MLRPAEQRGDLGVGAREPSLRVAGVGPQKADGNLVALGDLAHDPLAAGEGLRGHRLAAGSLVEEAADGRVDRLAEEELEAGGVQRADPVLRPVAVPSSQQTIVTLSSAARSVPRRSGVPIQHSAPAASIAARPDSARVVTRTACPSPTRSAASRLPRQPPATIKIRATGDDLTEPTPYGAPREYPRETKRTIHTRKACPRTDEFQTATPGPARSKGPAGPRCPEIQGGWRLSPSHGSKRCPAGGLSCLHALRLSCCRRGPAGAWVFLRVLGCMGCLECMGGVLRYYRGGPSLLCRGGAPGPRPVRAPPERYG